VNDSSDKENRKTLEDMFDDDTDDDEFSSSLDQNAAGGKPQEQGFVYPALLELHIGYFVLTI